MHHPKPKSSHRRKKGDSILKNAEELLTDRLEFDNNACGDYMELSHAGKMKTAEFQREAKKGRGKKHSHRRPKKPKAKAHEVAFRHHSLHATITTTKLLFRKEKSFNDAVQKLVEWKNEVDEREWERKQNYRIRRSREGDIRKFDKYGQREETEQQNALVDNFQEAKERRGKSLQKGHRATDRSPLLNTQNFNRFQEVIYCQVSHVSPPLKNHKNVAEVKYLYRRPKKGRKHDNLLAGSSRQKSVPCSKTSADFKTRRVEQDLTKFKKKSMHFESEEFAAEMSNTDYKSEVQQRGNIVPIEARKQKDSGSNVTKVKLTTEDRVRGQWQQKIKSETKHDVTRECSHSRKGMRNQNSQIEHHKIHQIVEGTYLKKIQSLINRKVRTLINKSKEIKLKVECASNTRKSVIKGRKTFKSGECVEDHATISTIKEDIVNEVLKRLKEELIVEKDARANRKKFSTGVTTVKAHEDIHNGAIKVFRNPAPRHHHSRRKSDLIPSRDQVGLANNQEDSATLRTILPDELPHNLVPIHKSRHNYGHKKILQESKTINSPILFSRKEARPREQQPQNNHPQLRMMASHSSDSSSEQEIVSTDKEIVRYHESNCREWSLGKFASEPDHYNISMMKLKSASDPYNKFLRSPPRTRVAQRTPHLRQIFVLPDDFRESQTYAHRRDSSMNGVGSPIHDFKHAKEERHTKRLECNIVSIIAIHPQKVRIADVMENKVKKYSSGRGFLDKRKLCRRFKLYRKYSAIEGNASEGSFDGRSLISDNTRIVSDFSREKTLKAQNLQSKNQRMDSEVLQQPNSYNQSSTPQNSHLNKTIEGFSDISINAKNKQYFVPITGTNEFYCRLLTSSRSENCLNTQDSNVSIPSKNTDHDIHVYCEERKCRYHRPEKSHSDFRFLSILNPRPQRLISKSDVAIRGGAKEVVKEIFKADHRPQSKPNRLPNNFSLSIQKRTEFQNNSCKKGQTITPRQGSCPEEDANPILHGLTDCWFKVQEQGSKIINRWMLPINNIDLAVGSPLPVNKADLTVSSPVRTAGNGKDNELEAELAADVAVSGEDEMMLPINAKRDQKRIEMVYVRNRKTTAFSPIRIIKEPPIQVATKCSRKIIRLEQPSLCNSQQETLIQSQNPIQTILTREREIKSVQYRPVRIQVKVELSPAITSRGAKTEESAMQYGQCIKVLRSPTQIMIDVVKKRSVQMIQTSEESVSDVQGVDVPFGVNHMSLDTNKVQVRKPADVVETYFHYHDPLENPNARSLSIAATDNNPPINEVATFRNCQSCSFALKEAAEDTFSLVNDVENPDRKSKSLVNVERSLRDYIERSKSEICRGIASFVNRNKLVLEIKGASFVSNYMENTMEKYVNNLNLRYTSKSHWSSPSQYITNRLTTRLVLDKNCRHISAYQKGKLYDASRRKKIKKNFTFRKEVDVGRETYEVRSTVNESKHAKQTFEKAILSVNLENVVERDSDKISASVSQGSEVDKTSKLKNHDCKFEKEDGISMTVGEDQERLKAICKKLLNLKAIDDNTFQEAISTCLQFAQQCSACKNFLVLVDNIQSLFDRYRSESNGHRGKSQEENFPDVHTSSEPPPPLDDRSESEQYLEKFQREKSSSVHTNIEFPSALENSSDSKDPYEKSPEENSLGVHTFTESPPALGGSLSIETIYSACLNKFSSDSVPMTVPSDKELDAVEFNCGSSKENGWCSIVQSMSCPNLPTTSSSCELFSEDEDNEAISGETLLVDLIKPYDYTFNINTCQYNMEMSHFAKGIFGSVESGYSTIRSGSYCPNCLVNVFERLNIAALLKPSTSIEKASNEDLVKTIRSEEMAKSSRKYARKVREMNSLRESDKEESTECSLLFLLSDNESAILGNRDITLEAQLTEVKEVGRVPTSYSIRGWNLILYNSCLKNKSEIQLGSTLVANLMNNEKLHKVQKQRLSYNDASMQGFLKTLIRAYDKEVEVCNKLYDDNEFFNVLLGLIQEQKRQKKRTFFKLFSRKSVGVRRGKVDEIKSEQEIRLLKKLKVKLQCLGSNARRCFPMLAEVLKANEKINYDQKICGISDWLEGIHNGKFELEQSGEDNDVEARITHHVKNSLIIAHKMCLRDAQKQKRVIGNCEIKLLMLVVMKYKFCLLHKAHVIISSIGRGIISTEFQLKAAVILLMRTRVERINRSMFEEYCRSLNK